MTKIIVDNSKYISYKRGKNPRESSRIRVSNAGYGNL